MSHITHKNLETVAGEIATCVQCAACQADCPTYELSLSETLTARGKIRLARGVLDGALKLSSRLENDFAQCLFCGACQAICPSNVDTMKIFTAMRAEIAETEGRGFVENFVQNRVAPYPARLNMMAKLLGVAAFFYNNAPRALARFLPFASGGVTKALPNFLQTNLRHRLPDVTLPNGQASEGKVQRVAYFSGCVTDLAFPTTGLNVVETMRHAGLEVVYPKEQICCGAPMYYSGDMEAADKMATSNIKTLAGVNADYIVCSCATCASTLGHLYPKLKPNGEADRISAKVIDFQSLMAQVDLRSAFSTQPAGRKLKVTYHDPCHLRKASGVWKEPRRLIASLPGVEYIEMEGAGRCCGGSGTFGLEYQGMALEQGRIKADAIRKSGADLVTTSCPACRLQLQDALKRIGHNTPVVNTADLVRYALSGEARRAME